MDFLTDRPVKVEYSSQCNYCTFNTACLCYTCKKTACRDTEKCPKLNPITTCGCKACNDYGTEACESCFDDIY